jgi:hypothetical protein
MRPPSALVKDAAGATSDSTARSGAAVGLELSTSLSAARSCGDAARGA